MRYYSAKEIEQLRSQQTLIVLHGKVVDVTGYLESHPGGKDLLLEVAAAGIDAIEHFEQAGHSGEAREIVQDLAIGIVSGYDRRASSEAESRRGASALVQIEAPRAGASRGLLVVPGAVFLALFVRLLVRHAPGLGLSWNSRTPFSWMLGSAPVLVLMLLLGSMGYWATSIIHVEFGYGRYPEVLD